MLTTILADIGIFIGGFFMGMILMAILAVSGRASREEEKRDLMMTPTQQNADQPSDSRRWSSKP